MSIEDTDTFGNYLVHGIDEIVIPDAIPWWPSAPAWKVLGVMLILLLMAQAIRWAKHWWRNRYRREALRQLEQLQRWYWVVCILTKELIYAELFLIR